ncbi:MAG: branched-chain amino acid ABC transporter permease [Syntrophorhabdales bacterium]|jgi:branched-chain amino acid transport system permease protein
MKKNLFLFFIFVALLIAYPLFFRNPFPRHLLIMIMMYAVMSIGWNIIGGYGGQVSFGNTVFFGVGAYASAVLLTKAGLSPWIGMAAGCVCSLALAVIVGYPCFRLKGHYFAIATIAVGEIMMGLFMVWDFVGGAVGIYLPILPQSFSNFEFHATKLPYYYIMLAIFLLALGVCSLVERSKLGYYLRAIKDDPDGARSVGISIRRYKLYAFSLSALLTSICGTFYAQYVLYIDPGSTFNLMISIQLCIISLIGGLGKLFGPVIGAFVFIPLVELTRVYLGSEGQGIDLMLYSLLMIVVAILRPQGLSGLFARGTR